MKKEDRLALINYLLDTDVPSIQILELIKLAKQQDITSFDEVKMLSGDIILKEASITEMGYYGNIWVRKQFYAKATDIRDGHKHKHDHVSLIATGSVNVFVEGEEPKTFKAPTFITIAAEKEHQIVALEDNTTVFCVFALRNEDGTLTDLYNDDNSPYAHDK